MHPRARFDAPLTRQLSVPAEMHYKHALTLTEQLAGESSVETCVRRNYLAGLFYAMKRYDEANELINRSAEIYTSKIRRLALDCNFVPFSSGSYCFFAPGKGEGDSW